MAHQVPSLENLIDQLERLPSIGRKSATRLAFHLLRAPAEEAKAFVDAIVQARDSIRECAVCCNLAEEEQCPVCTDPERDRTVLCVVEDPQDVGAFERTREYRGLYHVLHGTISPMEGIGPDKLRIRELLYRVANEDIREVIMGTNPTVEGEATAVYIAKLLKPFGVSVTRLAYGIPVGGDLEYADEITLRRSLENRNEL
ncbi:MAG: recombination protein RecR [Ruminococcaceae bacterium]|nr:recombination protein RecR [Oscillospiraceae bacterium]